jgi:hypothetical protein
MPAREGKCMLDQEPELTEEGDDVDLWLDLVAAHSPELANHLSQDAEAITWHGDDCFIQAIFNADLAQKILGDSEWIHVLRGTAKLIHEDFEVHITWPKD